MTPATTPSDAPVAGALPRPAGVRPRPLTELASRFGLRAELPEATEPASGPVAGTAPVAVTGVTLDSRAVRPGDLYAALPGAHVHGARFVPQALGAGARAVLTDPAGETALAGLPGGSDGPAVPLLVAEDPRAVLGRIAAAVYGEPSAGLDLYGVTGTNGKTTTTFILDALLGRLGHVTGLIGTIETRVAGRAVPSVRTTPEAPDLHGLLAAMREAGADAVSMEVSSQALTQHRVDGAHYRVAGFTNLSQDHLDLHGDMEHYYRAKALLFDPERAERAVVMVDTPWGRRLAEETAVPVTTLTADPDARADWRVTVDAAASGPGRTAFTLARTDVAGPPAFLERAGLRFATSIALAGDFNAHNAAVAILMLLAGGVPADELSAVLAGGIELDVPGRMQRVSGPAGPTAVVDFSHTPAALAGAVAALRPARPGRLVLVFGAGGDRDHGKRPKMGRAAAAADLVLVTDDNPRSEDPAAIRDSVLDGLRDAWREARAAGRTPVTVEEVPGREAAIRRAVALARDGDVILVAGKGHERGQEIAGTVHPFDDRIALARALSEAGWPPRGTVPTPSDPSQSVPEQRRENRYSPEQS